MTKKEYVKLTRAWMTKEMHPHLEKLAIPCDCEWRGCMGWRLSTILRSELPPKSLAKRITKKEE